MAIRKTVQELQNEASRRHLERTEREREARDKEWGGLRRPPPKMITVRPGLENDGPRLGERRRRCLDGTGGFITGVETVKSSEWIRRRILDGDLEELLADEVEAAIKEEEEAAAAAEAANQPPPEGEPPEGEPPPEGATQPPPPPEQPPTEAQSVLPQPEPPPAQPVQPVEQPIPAAVPSAPPAAPPAASFKQQRRAMRG